MNWDKEVQRKIQSNLSEINGKYLKLKKMTAKREKRKWIWISFILKKDWILLK